MDMAQFTIEGERPDIVKVEILETIQGLKKVITKRIAFKDFVKIINKSRLQEKRLRIGKVPNGFYDGYIDTDGDGFEALVIVPEGIKPFMYYESLYSIPFPTLLFQIKVRDKRVVSSYVYALKDEHVTDKSILYKYPFGNVHDTGSICWGSNTVTNINDLRSVEMAISMFFGSPTNDDLWNSKKINVPSDDPRNLQRGLVESLVGEKSYPKDLLVTSNSVVGSILKDG